MSALTRAGSPHNLAALPDAADLARRRVQIHDLTLEGDCEEMAGIRLVEARIEIARRLDAMGVPPLGAGQFPATDRGGDRECPGNRRPRSEGAALQFVKTPEEIETTARIGLSGTVILIGVNARFMPAGRDIGPVIDDARAMAERARGLDCTSLMAMDTTRAAPDDVHRFVVACDDVVDEFVICDSIGVACLGFCPVDRTGARLDGTPAAGALPQSYRHGGGERPGRCQAGVDIVHTCVNGWGEFAGQPALDEVAVALEMHLGVPSGLDLAADRSCASGRRCGGWPCRSISR